MSYKCPYCLYPFTNAIERTEGEKARKYFCPNPALDPFSENNEKLLCGKMLPPNFLNSESIVIALTGAYQVGKTYYYLALLDQLLNNRALHRLGIQGDIVGSPDDKKEINRFFKTVREEKRLLSTTSIEKAIKSVLHLTITKNKKTKDVYLSFFDNPGEKFSDLEYMIDNLTNVYRADGILFLIDPKQVEKLFRSIAKNHRFLLEEEGTDDLYTVLNNIIQLMRHVNTQNSPGISGRKTRWDRFRETILSSGEFQQAKIKTPIALAVSKFDLLKKAIHISIPYDETQLESMCIRDNGFNEEFVNAVSSEIDDFITGPPDGEARIKNLLQGNMKNYAFFGVKSIDIDDKGNPKMLNPQGVLIPLIWLLKRLGLYE